MLQLSLPSHQTDRTTTTSPSSTVCPSSAASSSTVILPAYKLICRLQRPHDHPSHSAGLPKARLSCQYQRQVSRRAANRSRPEWREFGLCVELHQRVRTGEVWKQGLLQRYVAYPYLQRNTGWFEAYIPGGYNDPALCAICGVDFYNVFKVHCPNAYAVSQI